jgi:hypothetical protein
MPAFINICRVIEYDETLDDSAFQEGDLRASCYPSKDLQTLIIYPPPCIPNSKYDLTVIHPRKCEQKNDRRLWLFSFGKRGETNLVASPKMPETEYLAARRERSTYIVPLQLDCYNMSARTEK